MMDVNSLKRSILRINKNLRNSSSMDGNYNSNTPFIHDLEKDWNNIVNVLYESKIIKKCYTEVR